jgi:hypothetical protein
MQLMANKSLACVVGRGVGDGMKPRAVVSPQDICSDRRRLCLTQVKAVYGLCKVG